MGDLHYFQAGNLEKAGDDQTRIQRRILLRTALCWYGMALERVQARVSSRIELQTMRDILDPQTVLDDTRQAAKRRILMDQATCLLLLGEPGYQKTAWLKVQEANKGDWSCATETDARLLYDAACWYGRAVQARFNVPQDALLTARRYLAYSLVRDSEGDLWERATTDADLASVRVCNDESWVKVKLTLLELKQNGLGAPTEKEAGVNATVKAIFADTGWPYSR